jgi:hypothetical protein
MNSRDIAKKLAECFTQKMMQKTDTDFSKKTIDSIVSDCMIECGLKKIRITSTTSNEQTVSLNRENQSNRPMSSHISNNFAVKTNNFNVVLYQRDDMDVEFNGVPIKRRRIE